jgi:hypothetical protein
MDADGSSVFGTLGGMGIERVETTKYDVDADYENRRRSRESFDTVEEAIAAAKKLPKVLRGGGDPFGDPVDMVFGPLFSRRYKLHGVRVARTVREWVGYADIDDGTWRTSRGVPVLDARLVEMEHAGAEAHPHVVYQLAERLVEPRKIHAGQLELDPADAEARVADARRNGYPHPQTKELLPLASATSSYSAKTGMTTVTFYVEEATAPTIVRIEPCRFATAAEAEDFMVAAIRGREAVYTTAYTTERLRIVCLAHAVERTEVAFTRGKALS